MKHAEFLTDKDKGELEQAKVLVNDGKRLRAKVLLRLRVRAYREIRRAK